MGGEARRSSAAVAAAPTIGGKQAPPQVFRSLAYIVSSREQHAWRPGAHSTSPSVRACLCSASAEGVSQPMWNVVVSEGRCGCDDGCRFEFRVAQQAELQWEGFGLTFVHSGALFKLQGPIVQRDEASAGWQGVHCWPCVASALLDHTARSQRLSGNDKVCIHRRKPFRVVWGACKCRPSWSSVSSLLLALTASGPFLCAHPSRPPSCFHNMSSVRCLSSLKWRTRGNWWQSTRRASESGRQRSRTMRVSGSLPASVDRFPHLQPLPQSCSCADAECSPVC